MLLSSRFRRVVVTCMQIRSEAIPPDSGCASKISSRYDDPLELYLSKTPISRTSRKVKYFQVFHPVAEKSDGSLPSIHGE